MALTVTSQLLELPSDMFLVVREILSHVVSTGNNARDRLDSSGRYANRYSLAGGNQFCDHQDEILNRLYRYHITWSMFYSRIYLLIFLNIHDLKVAHFLFSMCYLFPTKNLWNLDNLEIFKSEMIMCFCLVMYSFSISVSGVVHVPVSTRWICSADDS